MPLFRSRLDPDGYYDLLGVKPSAALTEIVTAYRQKARLLHPDVPRTGNSDAFVAVKQAYDVLSNQLQRADYDRAARDAAAAAARPAIGIPRPHQHPQAAPAA
ncbi:MAG: molecular chaperone DnaJ, partial [Acetobacteraceae bacterium]|nr:molecular chaperone DnaJ [Acetobacteraceae bacterium]